MFRRLRSTMHVGRWVLFSPWGHEYNTSGTKSHKTKLFRKALSNRSPKELRNNFYTFPGEIRDPFGPDLVSSIRKAAASPKCRELESFVPLQAILPGKDLLNLST